MKRLKYAFFGMIAITIVMLTGCGRHTITDVASSYEPTAMNTVVNGHTSGQKLKYKLSGAKDWHSTKVHSGAFTINIPRNNKTQTLRLKSGATEKKVTIQKSTPIMTFPKFLATYTFATQQNPKALQIKPKLNTTANFNGTIAKNETTQIRAVIANHQLMGLTLIVEGRTLEKTEGLNEFGSILGTLSGVTGADAKKVLKKFSDSTESVNSGKTTVDTIKSNGVNFDVSFSEKNVYIYITS